MKKFYLGLLMGMMMMVVGKVMAQIVSEGLNNSSALFTFAGAGQYYTGNSASGDGPGSSPLASEGTHSYGVTNGTTTLTSTNINSTGYTGVQLQFKLASFSVGGSTNGADVGDIVTVEVSPNGGTTYYSTLRVLGNANAWWPYSATGIASTAYDGNTTSVDISSGTGAAGISTVTLTNLPVVTNLRIKITLLNNAAAERWVVDDVKLTGTPATPCAGIPVAGTAVSTPSSVLSPVEQLH